MIDLMGFARPNTDANAISHHRVNIKLHGFGWAINPIPSRSLCTVLLYCMILQSGTYRLYYIPTIERWNKKFKR